MNNENELTAALATIKKRRAITGCPAGVDLQDHIRQLAAENAGLKRVPETDSVAMLLALDSFRSESLPDVGLQKAFKSLMYHRKTPATDAYLAGIKADGVEMAQAEQVNDDTTGKPLTITLPDISSKAFWSGAGRNETFHPETYRRWAKEAIQRGCIIACIDVEVK